MIGCNKDDFKTEIIESEEDIEDIFSVINKSGHLSKPDTIAYQILPLDTLFGNPKLIQDARLSTTEGIHTPMTVTNRAIGVRAYGMDENRAIFANTNSDVIWPGALLQAKSVRSREGLAAIPLGNKRASGTIYLNVVSGDKSKIYRDLEHMSGANVTQAMNDIMGSYSSGLPAEVNYLKTVVHSALDLAFHLGMSVDELETVSSGTFSGINWEEPKHRMLIKLYQPYFHMVYDYQGYEELFTEDITIEEIKRYSGEGNPMAYVSSVTYGRYFVLLYEFEAKVPYLDNILDKIINHEENNLSGNEINAFNYVYTRDINVRMFQVGGNAEEGLSLATLKSAAALKKFIVNGATFSKDNVGAPIAYNVRYVADASPVGRFSTIDEEFKTLTYVPKDKVNNVSFLIETISVPTMTHYSNWPGNPSKGPGHGWECGVKMSNVKIKVGTKTYEYDTGFNDDFHYSLAAIAYYKAPYKRFYFGDIGKDTNIPIQISFDVTFRIYTFKSSGGSDENEKFSVYVNYVFNKSTQRWQIADTNISVVPKHNSNRGQFSTLVDFNKIHIGRYNFNWSYYFFSLNYEFTSDAIVYK